jgi:AraC-like DNA-binding protein
MLFTHLINAASIGCLFFLAFLTLLKQGNTRTGYFFLSFVFIVLAAIFIHELLEYFDVYTLYPHLIIAFEPSLYALPPLIYLATYHLTTPEKKMSAKLLLHFIPYLLILSLYLLQFFVIRPHENEVVTVESDGADLILVCIFFIQIFLYLYFSLRLLGKHRQKLPLFVSTIADNDYHWLYKAIVGLSVLFVISFVEFTFSNIRISNFFSISYLVGFYYVGIQLSKQKEVFPFTREQTISVFELISEKDPTSISSDQPSLQPVLIDAEDNLQKRLLGKKKVISDEKLNDYKEHLLTYMAFEKPYLDSEITLPRMSNALKLTTYQTSYLINNCFGENFFTFINRYRLDKCKEMLIDPQYKNLTILGIAFDCGFNSKTAFNTAFKKYTGLSPKEFKDQADQSNNNTGSYLSTH